MKETAMKKKEPHAIADEKVVTWRALRTTAQEKAQTSAATTADIEGSRGSGPISSHLVLRRIAVQLPALEAADAAAVAHNDAAAAVDAADLTAGDPLMAACDLPSLYADQVASLERIERARAELRSLETAFAERVAAASAARMKVIDRRNAADQPHPQYVPDLSGAPREYLAVLAKKIAEGRPLKSNAAKITVLQTEDIETRAALERARIQREQEEADRAQRFEVEKRYREQSEEAERRSHAAERVAFEAEREKTRLLADAHRAREAGAP